MSSHTRIALFAATVWEVSAVRAALPMKSWTTGGRRLYVGRCGDREYWLLRTGVGFAKASQAASWLFGQQQFDLAVSTGFACALVPAEIGGLLVGSEVILMPTKGHPEPFEVPGAERDTFLAFAGEHVPRARCGRFLSVDRIIGRASEKREYARATAALGLDMESGALAREAQRRQVPFVIARTVSDLVDEDLPLDFNLFRRPSGWLRALTTLLSSPRSFGGLNRLRRQSRLAAAGLTKFFGAYAQAASLDTRHYHANTESA